MQYTDRERLERYARWMIAHQTLEQRQKILADHDEHYGKEHTDDLRSVLLKQWEFMKDMTDHEKHKLALADNAAQKEVLAS